MAEWLLAQSVNGGELAPKAGKHDAKQQAMGGQDAIIQNEIVE